MSVDILQNFREVLTVVQRRNFATRGPEARLYFVMGAAILFPAALFTYAWCTFPNVHWISLCIEITVRLEVSAMCDGLTRGQVIEFSSFLIFLVNADSRCL